MKGGGVSPVSSFCSLHGDQQLQLFVTTGCFWFWQTVHGPLSRIHVSFRQAKPNYFFTSLRLASGYADVYSKHSCVCKSSGREYIIIGGIICAIAINNVQQRCAFSGRRPAITILVLAKFHGLSIHSMP